MSDPIDYARGVKGEIDQRPKRFYTKADLRAVEGGLGVFLDGRLLRTPAGKALTLPTEALARLIAEEWDAQGERIDLQSMFATRLANVAIDRTPEARAEMAEEAARYASTDLTCYLAPGPEALRRQQADTWGPLRDWCGAELGVALQAVEGVAPALQPQASLDAARDFALALDNFALTALAYAVGLFGSAVLGFSVLRGRLSATEAFEASRIEEAFQNSQWGEDAEAAAVTARRRAEAAALDRWLAAVR